jgi:hypothetical protein
LGKGVEEIKWICAREGDKRRAGMASNIHFVELFVDFVVRLIVLYQLRHKSAVGKCKQLSILQGRA